MFKQDKSKQSRPAPAKRLGGKASDEQRVDNCNVPLDLRCQTLRPDQCDNGARANSLR